MVEAKFGYEMVDELMTNSGLPADRAYTAIGTYHHSEIVGLVAGLSQRTNTPVADLLRAFGQHLFLTFAKVYGHFFEQAHDAFQFLESIEHYIHVEVKKLYPDAELPRFQTSRPAAGSLEMIYHSERSMGDLAEGLIVSCLEYFGEKAEIRRESIGDDGRKERFLIVKI